MSRKYVIMFVMEDAEMEIIRVRNIDKIVMLDKIMMLKKTVRGQSPVRFGVVVKRGQSGVRTRCWG